MSTTLPPKRKMWYQLKIDITIKDFKKGKKQLRPTLVEISKLSVTFQQIAPKPTAIHQLCTAGYSEWLSNNIQASKIKS